MCDWNYRLQGIQLSWVFDNDGSERTRPKGLSGTIRLRAVRRYDATSRINGACRDEAREASEVGTPGSKFPGGHRGRVTPVPIPNTEVKPATADGTACVGVWESRSLPGLFLSTSPLCVSSQRAFFLYAGGHLAAYAATFAGIMVGR